MDRQTRMYDNFDKVEQRTIEEILNIVYDALEERGYNALGYRLWDCRQRLYMGL